MEKEPVVLPVEAGALTKVPVYEAHRRGRNWAATLLARDPRAPGGLQRAFWDRGRRGFYYLLPPDLGPGTAVEFGADYYTGGGRLCPCRWYGVVREVRADRLVLEPAPGPREALARGEELRSQLAALPDRAERAARLRTRIEALSRELEALRVELALLEGSS